MSSFIEGEHNPYRADNPLCRCPRTGYHARCIVHRNKVVGKNPSPAFQAYLVADRLLGSPVCMCRVCNEPIRRHSTGNYFHLAGFREHKAEP